MALAYVARSLGAARVHIVPIRADNYAYVIEDPSNASCVLVDPASPADVLACCTRLAVRPIAILTTHHHEDHAGGNDELVAQIGSSLRVYGGDDRVRALTDKLAGGETLELSKSLVFDVLHTPCHTRGHVVYVLRDADGAKAAFTGDTLFVAGCGRFFEGNGAQMHRALNEVIGALPDDTAIFCGHEYTLANLDFAASVEPENLAIRAKAEAVASALARNEPSVPSSLAEERTYNPFMRVHVPALQRLAGSTDPAAVMDYLRTAKNNF